MSYSTPQKFDFAVHSWFNACKSTTLIAHLVLLHPFKEVINRKQVFFFWCKHIEFQKRHLDGKEHISCTYTYGITGQS